MTRSLTFEEERVERLLEALEQLAGGATSDPIPISERHDEIDAVAFAVNVLVGELHFSERRRREALQQGAAEADRANRAKTLFLRNVNHEIRTPLAAIIAIADLLALEEIGAAERRELTERIRANGRALLGLVEEVLDLSKVEAGRLQLDFSPVSPRHVVAEAVASLEPQARAKGLALEVEVGEGVQEVIVTDQRRMRQILVNVIGNAIKFTERGRVGVVVERRGEGASELLEIAVTDTGLGIAAIEQDRLFQPFGQADHGPSHRFGGAGLGLVLAKRLAEGLGGDLALVASAPGSGSSFRITLAAALGERKEGGVGPSRAARPGRPDREPLRGLSILVAEDNLDLQFAMRGILELAGAKVELVGDGQSAVEQARDGRFDVIVMDVWMPRKDGLEATRELRRLGCPTPILACTADALKEHYATCLAAGCADCLMKPFDRRQLIDKVQALGHRPR